MQLRTATAAFVVCSLRGSAISMTADSGAMSQGHVITPGERKTILDMCSSFCGGDTVTIGSKEFTASPHGQSAASEPNAREPSKKARPLEKETAFWDQLFAPSFLQTDGTDVEKPFPQLVNCAQMCQGHMLMCIRKSGPTELKAAEEYQSCLATVSAEKKVDKADQDRLELLRQKEETLVGSMLCRNMCRDSAKHSGCEDACDVEMKECLDKMTDDECQQMLMPDYSNYTGPPKVQMVQPAKAKARAALRHQKKAAGKETAGKTAVKVAGKDAAIKATAKKA